MLLIIAIAGVAFSLTLIFHFGFKNPIQYGLALLNSAIDAPRQEQAVFGLPVRLKIPSINVDTYIEYVGLTPDGAMGVPKDPSNVVWFNLGPRPGENGSAVIAGHYGWKNNIPAAFDNLNKLNKGDKLYIEDDKGATISFVVRESRMYDSKADASDVFNSDDGKPHLNLITCEGAWDKSSKNYSDRLVVFADKE